VVSIGPFLFIDPFFDLVCIVSPEAGNVNAFASAGFNDDTSEEEPMFQSDRSDLGIGNGDFGGTEPSSFSVGDLVIF